MSLSDSIVIAAELPENAGAETDGGENFQTGLLDMVCQAAGQAIRFAAQAGVPLVYRGVVAAGSLAVKKNTFLIGPAIDEAAELMQLADGAFVCLAASALEIEPPNHRPHAWQSMAIDYEVPLKGGARLRGRIRFDSSTTSMLSLAFHQASGADPLCARVRRTDAGDTRSQRWSSSSRKSPAANSLPRSEWHVSPELGWRAATAPRNASLDSSTSSGPPTAHPTILR